MIKYVLAKNAFTKNDDKFVALISGSETKTMDDIIDMMVSEGTGMTRPQTLAYFEKLKQTIRFFLQHGYSVNTPLVRFRPSIRGSFRNFDDRFQPGRHRLEMRAIAGSYIKEIEPVAKLMYVQVDHHPPRPVLLVDATTNCSCCSIAAGSIGKLMGDFLSFDASDVLQGVFLTPIGTGGDELRLQTYSYITNNEIHFLFPLSAKGDFTLKIRSLDRLQKTLLTGTLPTKIKIQA